MVTTSDSLEFRIYAGDSGLHQINSSSSLKSGKPDRVLHPFGGSADLSNTHSMFKLGVVWLKRAKFTGLTM